ncbi:MAG: hypothetical protein M3N82_06735 [Pseudomonadota bacterium]|nr:hypothetical protein [Pseudomonadota bacterium]
MHISTDQMSAFEQTRRAGFLARIRAFLCERVQRPVADADLARLCARGEAYGLVSEQELAGYVVMAWAVEAWHAPQDPEWIARIMGDPHRVASDRVAALYRAADGGAARS